MLLYSLYKANRFHVAMCLFRNRSQMTSKCGKNISDTLGYASCATFFFLPHFDVICDLLLNRHTATWNLFVNYITSNLYIKVSAGKAPMGLFRGTQVKTNMEKFSVECHSVDLVVTAWS